MSNYVPRPNSGTLWPNNKRADNHPDVRGDLYIDRKFIEKMLRNTDDDLVKVQVSGWEKFIAGKDCLSLSVSEPYEKEQRSYSNQQSRPSYASNRKPVSDEEIPF